MAPILKDLKRKITKSCELTAREKMTVLTLIERWHWVADWYCNHAKEFLCSVCNSTVYYDYYTRSIGYDYCPYCGARMDSQKGNKS